MGVCLLVVRREFPREVPSVSSYARSVGMSVDTIQRACGPVWQRLVELLRERRPGRRPSAGAPEPQTEDPQLSLLLALNAILRSLLPGPVAGLLDTPHKRGMLVQQILHWRARGVRLEKLAELVGLPERTLRRWIDKFHHEGNGEVPHRSRRPNESPNRTPHEIRDAIFKLRRIRDFSKIGYAEFARVFNRRFKALLEQHGLDEISAKTVARYLDEPQKPEEQVSTPSRRGAYDYPAPMAMAWIDTTYFKVAGVTVHIVGAMESFSRMALAAEAFVQESAASSVTVLSDTLAKVPGLGAVVRDRGKPFLNSEVDDFLAEHGCLPINAHPYFPLDKAALERWWRSLKQWLRQALIPFERECEREGREPTKEEIVEIVGPALRVFLRAYNLLPQASLEGRCPVERLEAALREVGASSQDLDHLRKLAAERRTRDELLEEIRGGLQVDVDLKTVRRELASISDQALKDAWDACRPRLLVERDPTIRHPYRYFLAVAINKDEARRQERAQAHRREQEEKQFRERARNDRERQTREQQEREQCPEQYLGDDLMRWIKVRTCRIASARAYFVRVLRETLQSLREKLTDAYSAHVLETKALIPQIAAQLGPAHVALIPTLESEFLRMALGPAQAEKGGDTPHHDAEPRTLPARRRGSLRSSAPDAPLHIGNPVRQVLDRLLPPHD